MRRPPDPHSHARGYAPPLHPKLRIISFVLMGLVLGLSAVRASYQGSSEKDGITVAAAESCGAKVKRLEDHAAAPAPKEKQTVRISQQEINSYLALVLSPAYHPSLKKIVFRFDQGKLQAAATVDFDLLAMNSEELLTRLLSKMLAGVHVLTIKGGLISEAGKGSFILDEASFDNTTIPNVVVSEIISAVGKKQRPPFDPMKPSQMPYDIEKVELHPGYILIHQ